MDKYSYFKSIAHIYHLFNIHMSVITSVLVCITVVLCLITPFIAVSHHLSEIEKNKDNKKIPKFLKALYSSIPISIILTSLACVSFAVPNHINGKNAFHDYHTARASHTIHTTKKQMNMYNRNYIKSVNKRYLKESSKSLYMQNQANQDSKTLGQIQYNRTKFFEAEDKLGNLKDSHINALAQRHYRKTKNPNCLIRFIAKI